MFAIIQLLKAHRTDRKKDSCWRLIGRVNFHVGFFRNGIFYRVDTVKYMKHKLEIKFKVCALKEILLPNFANLHQNTLLTSVQIEWKVLNFEQWVMKSDVVY